jgi:hypothetical protein
MAAYGIGKLELISTPEFTEWADLDDAKKAIVLKDRIALAKRRGLVSTWGRVKSIRRK